MSPDKQRIAIAEACGWKSIGREKNLPLYGWISPGPLEEIPDYLHDLNAMHETEAWLTEPQRLAYVRELVVTCEPHLRQVIFGLDAGRGWWLAHASAAQRAEAFLRTVGKWEDGK